MPPARASLCAPGAEGVENRPLLVRAVQTLLVRSLRALWPCLPAEGTLRSAPLRSARWVSFAAVVVGGQDAFWGEAGTLL